MDQMKLQQEHLERILRDQGITSKELADTLGVTRVTVSRWKNGTRSIRLSSALEINKVYPQYAPDWIMGKTETMNEAEAIAQTAKETYLSKKPDVKGLLEIANYAGYNIHLDMFNTRNETLKQALFDATNARYKAADATFIDVATNTRITPKSTITHRGQSYTVEHADLEELADELTDYVSVRLKRLCSKTN